MVSPLIELETFLPYRIAVLASVMGTAIASAYVDRYGLTIPEWRVIAVLTRYPGLSAREVAEKSHMDAVAVSRAVNRLLRAGRLRRAIARDDRRRSVLQVSDAGAVVYREVAPMALDFERALIDALPAGDRAMLDRALDVLMQRAENLSTMFRGNDPAPADKRKVTRTASRHRTAR